MKCSKMLVVILIMGMGISCGKKAEPQTEEVTPKDDQGLLQGTWKPITAIADGDKIPEIQFEDGSVEIAGDRMVFKVEGRVEEICKLTLDPNQKPKSIDLAVIDEKGIVQKLTNNKNEAIEWVRKGIYSIDGNQLRVCTPDGVGVPRPTQFDALAGTGLTVMTFQKVR